MPWRCCRSSECLGVFQIDVVTPRSHAFHFGVCLFARVVFGCRSTTLISFLLNFSFAFLRLGLGQCVDILKIVQGGGFVERFRLSWRVWFSSQVANCIVFVVFLFSKRQDKGHVTMMREFECSAFASNSDQLSSQVKEVIQVSKTVPNSSNRTMSSWTWSASTSPVICFCEMFPLRRCAGIDSNSYSCL